jgi:hypothetical protein
VLNLTLSSIPMWVKLAHLPVEFWTITCLSHVASGVRKPLYADRITEEQKRLGFARVLVEIDTASVCPKEVIIQKENGSTISVGIEHPWLPPKRSGCGSFGHAAYACAKKERKVWIPKKQVPSPKPVQPMQKKKEFDKTIRRPSGTPRAKSKSGGIRLPNSFGNLGGMDENEEEILIRTPIFCSVSAVEGLQVVKGYVGFCFSCMFCFCCSPCGCIVPGFSDVCCCVWFIIDFFHIKKKKKRKVDFSFWQMMLPSLVQVKV